MKLSIGNVLSIVFLTMFLTLTICVLNVYTYINKAVDYHETCIAEIEASNFSSDVINEYTKNTDENGKEKPFKTVITNKTVLNSDDNLERVGRIYEVKTTYTIKIPLINYSVDKTIQGFAR